MDPRTGVVGKARTVSNILITIHETLQLQSPLWGEYSFIVA